ncbi:hypothetical protein V6N13_055073 [Hibiscus sabdariffa]
MYGHSKDACGKSHDHPVEADSSKDGIESNAKVEILELNLFGPWMVVENHRQRFGTGGDSNAQHPSILGNGRGSRFAVLENVESMGPSDNSEGAVE